MKSVCLLFLLLIGVIYGQDYEASTTELPLSTVTDCTLAPEVGLCKALIPRYFYNSTSKQCEEFFYGGCGGNSNNFLSVEECQVKCTEGETVKVITEPQPVNCDVEPEVGMCKALIPRFFHNATSRQCEEFFYGGCGGNTNNFLSLEECQTQCVSEPKVVTEEEPTVVNCLADPEVGMCLARLPRYFHNATSKKCEEFVYGGCRGNSNNFGSLEECQAKCEVNCDVEPDVGLCKALIPRYFHNSTSKRCEEFFYGGCLGNTNNFLSLEECQTRCVSDVPTVKAVEPVEESGEVDCTASPDVGMCLARLPRYFHNATSHTCEEFFYGGCRGNTNNFGSLEECQAKCNVQVAETNSCTVEPDVGLCKALIPRYFHNATSKQCEQFIYGGCLGNSNNFLSLEECQKKCNVSEPSGTSKILEEDTGNEVNCSVEPDVGLCKALIPRFFHNATSRRCEQFIYGGCRGNTNNFMSLEECQTRCERTTERTLESEQNDCTLSYEVGNCRAMLPRYFYNSTSKTCEIFYYGGCGGNNNRFLTVDDCLAKCDKQTVFSVFPKPTDDTQARSLGTNVRTGQNGGATLTTSNALKGAFLVPLAVTLLLC